MYVIFCKYCIDAIDDVIPSKLIILPQEMLKIAQVIKKMIVLQNIHTVNIEQVESHAQKQLLSYVMLFYSCTIDNELVIISSHTYRM